MNFDEHDLRTQMHQHRAGMRHLKTNTGDACDTFLPKGHKAF